MNGARSIFMRKGYWLTALAAIVLLAASPGTASAQVEVTGPAEVTEGGTASYTVEVEGYIQPQTTPAENMVTVALEVTQGSAGDDTEGELEFDISKNLPTALVLTVPAGENSGEADAEAKFFSARGVIRVQTTHDTDAEDEDFTLAFTATFGGGTLTEEEDAESDAVALADDDFPDALTIKDAQTQSYDLTTDDDDAKEGQAGDVIVTVTANPAHVNGSAMLAVQLDAERSIASITTPETAELEVIDVGNRTRDITITLGGNDKNRDEDTITVSVHSGSAGNSVPEDSLSIDIEDKHALPAVAMMVVEDGDALDPQPTSVKEGESVMVVVTVVDKDDKTIEAAEKLTVALMPTGTADSADYTLVGSSDIDKDDKMSGVIEIEVRSDEDVGMELLMFDAVVTGDSANGPGTRPSAGVLSLYIDDATAKKITPKASEADYDALKAVIAEAGGDDGVNPGDTVTIMTSDLFDLMEGYTASYGVSVDGDSASASASGESVTINALMAGEAKITVTGTARMASSSLIPTQTVSNVAELTFPVMVVDTELVVTLSADPMEIEAGGMSTITATANRAVTVGDGEVAIALAVVGDGTLDPESIMIAMGDMSGSATLTANESVTVVATGSGITGLMQVKVTVTDAPDPDAPDPDAPDPDAPDPDAPDPDPEPVPALPLIAQWLLGLGLMGGGARQLFRRRRQG